MKTQAFNDALKRRYKAAAHRMQSAAAFDLTRRLNIGLRSRMGDLRVEDVNRAMKDLRVGVNTALSDAGGLARLLIEKGVFTESEYITAVCLAMEREADQRCAEVIQRYDLPPGTDFR